MRSYGLLAALVLTLTACGGGEDTPPANNSGRPSNTTCLAGAASGYSTLRYRNAFPNLSFAAPVAMLPAPSGNTLYVVELGGTIRAFDNNPAVTTSTEFGNIGVLLDRRGEGGLLGMAFDPNFTTNGFVYLSYTAPVPANQQIPNIRTMWSRVTRFATNAAHTQMINTPERFILQVDQPYTNHNGGQIAFDSSGNLYLGLGDGGSSNDPNQNGQRLTNLLGAMVRINPNIADNTGRGLNYGIPNSNPFYGNNNCNSACPEIFAWGLRNPWRWSFDRDTGALFAGDVGQGAREEIDLIQSGKNYGWGCYEGTLFNTSYGGDCSALIATPSLHTLPIHDYPRSDGTTVTGGYVYRGNAIPNLRGQYIFADYGSGTVWAIENPYSNPIRRTLFNTGRNIVSMAEDAAGELYLIDIAGSIYLIEPDPGSLPTPPFASQLSATGCANSVDPKLPASGLIPYEINAPLWSDNADKYRWLSLPDNTTIDIDANHDWHFPIGSVLRKDFYLNNQIVETRLLAHHTDGSWAGYSYEWNNTQTDATLLADAKTISVGAQQWTFPSPAQCTQCHTSVAGRTLGPETAQLNRVITKPKSSELINQIDYFKSLELFTVAPANPANLPRLASYDDLNASPESLARAYLHSNCSNCHQPNGPVISTMNLHYNVNFIAMNICGAPNNFGPVLGATQLFAPNNLTDSIIYQRMHTAAMDMRMPPIGTAIEDIDGLGFIANWITSVATCPP